MQLKDFKPEDLVSFRTINGPWVDGVVSKVETTASSGSTSTAVSVHAVSANASPSAGYFREECSVGLFLKRRYLYAIGEEVEVMPWTGAAWSYGKVTRHPSGPEEQHGGVYVLTPTHPEYPCFYRYASIRKKPVETEQDRIDKATKPLHGEIERLKQELTCERNNAAQEVGTLKKELANVETVACLNARNRDEWVSRAEKSEKELAASGLRERFLQGELEMRVKRTAMLTKEWEVVCAERDRARVCADLAEKELARLQKEYANGWLFTANQSVGEARERAEKADAEIKALNGLLSDLKTAALENGAIMYRVNDAVQRAGAVGMVSWPDAIDQIATERANARTERDTAHREVDRLKKEWNDMRKERDQSHANATHLKNDYIRAVSERTEAEKTLARFAGMQEEVERLKRAVDNESKRADANYMEYARLKNQIPRMQAELDELSGKLADVRKALS